MNIERELVKENARDFYKREVEPLKSKILEFKQEADAAFESARRYEDLYARALGEEEDDKELRNLMFHYMITNYRHARILRYAVQEFEDIVHDWETCSFLER